MFILDSVIVFGGSSLNALGKYFFLLIFQIRKYWRYFASKDYFDEDGLFFSLMVSFPLLILTSVQIVFILGWSNV